MVSAGGRKGASGDAAAVEATDGTAVDVDAADTDGVDAAATVPRSQGFGGDGVAIRVKSDCGGSESSASAIGTRDKASSGNGSVT